MSTKYILSLSLGFDTIDEAVAKSKELGVSDFSIYSDREDSTPATAPVVPADPVPETIPEPAVGSGPSA